MLQAALAPTKPAIKFALLALKVPENAKMTELKKSEPSMT